MTVEDQIGQLEHCVEAFAASFAALDERLFLRKFHGWTPRDIVAHLIGWNRHIILGAKQILRGELPFYDVDPGPNYSKVNATLVRECDDTDRSVLLEKLAESARELIAFLRKIAPEEWDHDFGIRHKGEKLTVKSTADDLVTVKSTVDDLIADYDHHIVQLDEEQEVSPGKTYIETEMCLVPPVFTLADHPFFRLRTVRVPHKGQIYSGERRLSYCTPYDEHPCDERWLHPVLSLPVLCGTANKARFMLVQYFRPRKFELRPAWGANS